MGFYNGVMVASFAVVAFAALPFMTPEAARFDIVALGVGGGLVEGDLTSFLLARHGEQKFIGLDAGSVGSGLAKAAVDFGDVKAWAITHPHLDHVEGLAMNIVNATGTVPLYGLSSTIDALRDHLFNGVLWANFGNEGKPPQLGRLRYERLAPGRAVVVPELGFTIEALPLSHAGGTSTAFLVGDGDGVVCFVGDTGPDLVEHSHQLDLLWQRLAPLVRGGKLKALFIETSYANDRKNELLFGHLTPRWLWMELQALASSSDPSSPKTALRGLPVIVMHIKPAPGAAETIRKELDGGNDLGVRLLFPRQGERISF